MSKKKEFSFSNPENSFKKEKTLSALDVLTSKEDKSLNSFKDQLINSLIELLKDNYKNEKWKYKLIKNAKELYDLNLQYNQLNAFEKGQNTSSNILYVVMKEVSRLKGNISINFKKNGKVFINS